MKLDSIARVEYDTLSHQKRKNYNFHKLAAILAEYGFNCIKPSNVEEGSDFLAVHEQVTLKVKLKPRITISKKYLNEDLYIAFPLNDGDISSGWCLIKHDLLVDIIKNTKNWLNTSSWIDTGLYHKATTPKEVLPYLEKYIINTKRSLSL